MKQYDKTNVFAKIISGDLPANKVYETDKVLAFHTINPLADTHVLVIPKGEYVDYEDFITKSTTSGTDEIGEFFVSISKIAKKLGLSEYRLVTNCGKNAGQEVFHFHVHILSGNIKL